MKDIQNLSSVRMCVQKPLHDEHGIYSDLGTVAKSGDHFNRLQAAFNKTKLWAKDKKELTIQFCKPGQGYTIQGQPISGGSLQWTPIEAFGPLDKQDPLTREFHGSSDYENIVKTIYIKRYQPILPFKLRFVESGGEIRISFVSGVGSWSLVGTDATVSPPNEITLNYGWMDIPTILHEFGHVLGMIHEHQNPNGEAIKWNEPVLYEWAQDTQGWDKEKTYQNIVMKYDKDMINGSKFDPDSIMLYFFPGQLCEANGSIRPEIRPPCPSDFKTVNFTMDGKGTHANPILSPVDLEWIQNIYPGGKGVSISPITGGNTGDGDTGNTGGNTGGGKGTGHKITSYKELVGAGKGQVVPETSDNIPDKDNGKMNKIWIIAGGSVISLIIIIFILILLFGGNKKKKSRKH